MVLTLILAVLIPATILAVVIHGVMWLSASVLGFNGAASVYVIELVAFYWLFDHLGQGFNDGVQSGDLDGPVGFFTGAIIGAFMLLAIATAILNALGLAFFVKYRPSKPYKGKPS